MTLLTLGRSPEVWTHDHRRRDPAYFFCHDPAFAGASRSKIERLAAMPDLKRLIASSRAPAIAIHAISDSQRADELLTELPQARCVWIYRNYCDVANSAVAMWGGHQRDLIRRVRDGQWKRLGWRGERLSEFDARRVCNIFNDDISDHDGAALYWHLRNAWFFRLNLANHPRVLLVKYEELVRDRATHVRRLFEFLGLDFDEQFTRHIYSSSMGRQPPPSFDAPVQAICDELLRQLDSAMIADVPGAERFLSPDCRSTLPAAGEPK